MRFIESDDTNQNKLTKKSKRKGVLQVIRPKRKKESK